MIEDERSYNTLRLYDDQKMIRMSWVYYRTYVYIIRPYTG